MFNEMINAMFAGNAGWFGYPAVFGTLFFVVRMVLMFVGGDSDMAGDVDVDVDVDADTHSDPGDAAKLLSVQGAFTFLMGFGWGGLAARNGFGLETVPTLVCGIATGAAMVWVLGLLLKAVYDLQSSGNIPIESTVGLEGSVYARVPSRGDGRGQVRLVVSKRQRIYSAITEGDSIERNTRIRVTRVNSDNTLTVVTA